MCQLLGIKYNVPTDIVFSFTDFVSRGGQTDHHSASWGVAFFEGSGMRHFVDYQAAIASPVAELIRHCQIESKNVIVHIRKARSPCKIFTRLCAHRVAVTGCSPNGDRKEFAPRIDELYRPVGNTDSGLVFCYLLQQLC